MFFTREVWCKADVSSVSPLSKQTEVWCKADVSSVSPLSEQTEVWCIADVSSVSPSSEQTEVWCIAEVSSVSPSSEQTLILTYVSKSAPFRHVLVKVANLHNLDRFLCDSHRPQEASGRLPATDLHG